MSFNVRDILRSHVGINFPPHLNPVYASPATARPGVSVISTHTQADTVL